MTASVIDRLARANAFLPRQRMRQLVHDHVPFDELMEQDKFESSALRGITDDSTAVAVIGPRGGGKSSLIACVCSRLPETHIALRVPVTGADDPTSVSVVAAVALGEALDAIELDRHQRVPLTKARADSRVELGPTRSLGGKLGGGPLPAAIHGELATLRTELNQGTLAADRLSGIERLISILVARGIQPIFVFEDTEAAIGSDGLEAADAFLAGPVRAFAHEVDASCLVAIQDVFRDAPAFKQLAPGLALIDLPALNGERASRALRAIIDNRIAQQEIDTTAGSVIGDDALDMLVGFYGETGQNLRLTLAALRSATDHAADNGADLIETGHLRAATSEWRDRVG
jgi:hypothetical protein